MRTLVRAGCRAHLVRVDGRGGPLFWVSGPEGRDNERFYELREANAWFEKLERGYRPQKARRPGWRWSGQQRASQQTA
jgi:hypothetical protein